MDKQQLKSILIAVKAGVGRDEKLMAAVQAGAARDKRILAAIEAGNARNASIRRNVHELGGALRKTKSRELVKRMKEAALGQSELELEDVEELPFAEGGQGAVFRGYLGGEIVCLKKISMVGVPAVKRTKMLSSFKTELGIMIRLRHPRTVQVLGVVTTNPTFLGLVMEYLPGGSLRHALDRDDEMITPEYQRFWTADVALGMAHLYSQGVEHRDLKTHNVLLCVEIKRCIDATPARWRGDRASRLEDPQRAAHARRAVQGDRLWALSLRGAEDVHDDRDDERQRRGDARVHGAGII